MAISSPGIGSNLDIGGIITKLMQIEAQPLNVLDTREASFQAKLTAYGTLKSVLSTFQSTLTALKDATKFTGLKANSSDTSVVGATATNDSVAGTYAINVSTLARAQIQAAGTKYTDTTTALGLSGSISFTVAGNSFSVPVAATDNLQDIAEAINTATSNSGVSASIVNDGGTPGNRLVITGTKTGTANTVTIDDSALSASFAFAESQSALDLSLTVNGIAVTKPSNTVTDAIQGVTLNVLKEGAATVTVAKDSSSAKSAIEAFVKAYNDLSKALKDSSAYNKETKQAAILQGEASVRVIQSQVRSALSAQVSGTDTYHTLSQLGITFQSDGTLKLDSTKLGDALTTNAADVAKFFAGDGKDGNPLGMATRLDSLVSGLIGTSGLLSSTTDSINRSIKAIEDRREVLNRRLADVEDRYRKQYTALDTLIGTMTQTSNYLQQQLANLPKAGT